jgi:hypothetical protein
MKIIKPEHTALAMDLARCAIDAHSKTTLSQVDSALLLNCGKLIRDLIEERMALNLLIEQAQDWRNSDELLGLRFRMMYAPETKS